MNAGQLIADARTLTGLTQTELASRMGTHQSVVARWETGKTQPSFESVVKAVEAAGLELMIDIAGSDLGHPQLSVASGDDETTRSIQELRQMGADHARLRWIKSR